MSGHPPFGVQIILNGHDHVACDAGPAGIAFGKEDNSFTDANDPAGLTEVADTSLGASIKSRVDHCTVNERPRQTLGSMTSSEKCSELSAMTA